MRFDSSIHNHCTLCDGASTPDEMVEAALAAGIRDLGFSCHAYDPLAPRFSLADEETYVATIRALAERYEGRIRIACGIEQDAATPVQHPENLDYRIGSVHYVRAHGQGSFYSIDEDVDTVMRLIEGPFDHDALACVEAYYAQLVALAVDQKPDVIGHFDIITKLNDEGRLFDEQSIRYRMLALSALDAVVASGAVIEVNTAAIRRGMGRPYPDRFLLERLHELEAPLVITTDCHDASQLTAGVSKAAALLVALGFTEVLAWEKDGFVQRPLVG